MTTSSRILSTFQMQKWPPFNSSSSPLSSYSSFSQHQVLIYAKQHIVMIWSDHRWLNSLFNSIQPLDKPNAVGFNLSCNSRNQTILSLPYYGDFVVYFIDYFLQSLLIKDPDGCLPRRFLNQSFTLLGSPFHFEFYNNYTFYNCSEETIYKRARRVSCLSGDNFTVWKTSSPFTEL